MLKVLILLFVSYSVTVHTFPTIISPKSSSLSLSLPPPPPHDDDVYPSTTYHSHSSRSSSLKRSTTVLFAKKTSSSSSKKKKGGGNNRKNTVGQRKQSSSGFGGAAVEPCPCGSGEGYMKCCGLIHTNKSDAFATASASQIVRARYSAYAKRAVDFIIASTHPLNEQNFQANIDHWRETIKLNCYDNFELKSCRIVAEEYQGESGALDETATVKFVATMTQKDSREKVAFMETSTFKRAGKHIHGGAWLYQHGLVEDVPSDYPEAMNNYKADDDNINEQQGDNDDFDIDGDGTKE